MYYVYAHLKPDNTVFYVGKGTRERAWSKHGRSVRWQRTVAKYGYSVCLLADNLSQAQAIEEEASVIAHFKPFGTLVNLLDRGDISPTSNPDVAAKVSIAASTWQTGRTLSAEHRANISKNSAWRGKKRPDHALLLKQKGVFSGEKNPGYGAGSKQLGELNPVATAVIGVHSVHGEQRWGCMKDAAHALGVSVQAISQAVKKQQRSKGWSFRKAV